jgi:Mrp family chromosome partitioning ATPase
VGLLPDGQLLARLVRAVVFVIGAGTTPAAVVEKAIAELGRDCIVGTVLNSVDENTIPATGYYRKYYESEVSASDR